MVSTPAVTNFDIDLSRHIDLYNELISYIKSRIHSDVENTMKTGNMNEKLRELVYSSNNEYAEFLIYISKNVESLVSNIFENEPNSLDEICRYFRDEVN